MSAKVFASIEGLDSLDASLKGLEERVREQVRIAQNANAEGVAARAIAGINSPPKTGILYTHQFPGGGGYKRAKPHRASAAGEYPAADTGNLARSIYAGDLEEDFLKIDAPVEADAEYAKPLEYKPPGRGGRPFLRRALMEEGDMIRARLSRAVIDAIRKGRAPMRARPPTQATPTSPVRSFPRRPPAPRQITSDDLNRGELRRLTGPSSPPSLPPPDDPQ